MSPRSNSSALADAKSDRLFDSDVDEAALEHAFAELTIERKRLSHEVAWVTDLAPSRARSLIEKLSKLSAANASDDIPTGSQLSSINVAAHLLSRFPDHAVLREALFKAYAVIDWPSVRQTIDEARLISGFGATKDVSWKQAQSELVEAHAAVVLMTITRVSEGPELLASMMAAAQGNSGAGSDLLLERVVSQYDRWSVPHLEKLSEQIDVALDAIKAGDNTDANLSALDRLLPEWDRISQPVQLRDQAKGLDEPRSLRLFDRARSVAVWIANEREEHRAALQITEAFAGAFSELPTVASKTAADRETLIENIADTDARALVAPLRSAADVALDNLSDVAKQIRSSGFSGGARGHTGTLFTTFDFARDNCGSLPDPSLPWIIVRQVALALNNDFKADDAAKAVIESIIGTAPDRARELLEGDLLALRKFKLQADFGQAVQRSDWRAARDMIPEMIEASPEEESDLLNARVNLDERIRSRNAKRIGWAIAAAVLLIIFISNGSKPTSPPPSTFTDDTTVNDTMTAPDATLAPDPAPLDTTAEEPPPIGAAALSLPQLRYCKFENARIEALRGMTSNAVISSFNAKVDDYNSRCGSFQYRAEDMVQVDGEVASSQSRIDADARKTLRQWKASSPPPAPIIPTYSEPPSGDTAPTTVTPDGDPAPEGQPDGQ